MSISRERRPIRRDAKVNREAILIAARHVLAADPDAPLEAVASAAGLSRRALYGHFASREELRLELARTGAHRVAAAVADAERPDSRVTLALIAARLWRAVADVRVLTQSTLEGPLLAELAEPLTPVRQLLARTVERGASEGELRSDIPAATLSRLIEAAALAVLDEAARTDMPATEAEDLAMRNVLAAAGLSWREAAALIDDHPDLREDS